MSVEDAGPPETIPDTQQGWPRPAGTAAPSVFDTRGNELAALAAVGDPRAANELLEMLRPTIVRYCRARIGRSMGTFDTADDVAQEACLGIYVALPSYHGKAYPFMALAYRIAANKVADHFRKQRTNRCLPVEEVPEIGDRLPDPEQVLLSNELSERLGMLLDVLGSKQREILILRLVVGMSAEETAQTLGSTRGAVRVAQHRALNRLRAALGAGDHPAIKANV